MNCPRCRNELEIFARGGEEIYVCPSCLSALLPGQSPAKILKYFCTQELCTRLISNIMDDSFFENTKETLKSSDNITCPKCRLLMGRYDFDNKLKFFVNRCTKCGSIWLNPSQIPLVAISLVEKNNPDDVNFKETVNNLYQITARKRNVKVRSLDDILAPYAAIPLSLFGSPAGAAFPTGDNIITKTSANATKCLIAACCAVFVLDLFTGIWPAFSLIAAEVLKNQQWYRLITYAFLHAGLFHLFGNMWFLWIFGRTVEDKTGWKNYLLLFTASAVLSAILFISTAADKTIPCVGASGAISGVIGAYLILFPKAKIRFHIFGKLGTYRTTTFVPAWVYILVWLGLNVVYGILQSGSEVLAVAYWGHIGGFIAGVIFAELYKNLKQG